MAAKFSAYLSIYNDWDVLPRTLDSIAPYVDELVVVDGAYRWMAPYVSALGADPLRSDQRVYDAIEASGIPFRVVSGLWSSEIEKRKAGYLACRHRFIYRVDADEVYFFNERVLDDFLKTDGAAASMEMPLYAAPGWIIGESAAAPIERQGLLFDSEKITADQHLFYLWLVLTVDQLPAEQQDRPPSFDLPIAFAAHLSHWRTPLTSVNRAAFYLLNWVRANGAPWFEELRSQPLPDLSALFERVPPEVFRDVLTGHSIVMGHEELRRRILKRSPLATADEQKFADLFDVFLRGQAAANQRIAGRGRHMLGQTQIDLSSPAALAALTRANMLGFRLGSAIVASKAAVTYLVPRAPWEIVREIEPRIDGSAMNIDIAGPGAEPPDWLRRILALEVWCEDRAPLQRLACLSAG